jgi:hypothetical protein
MRAHPNMVQCRVLVTFTSRGANSKPSTSDQPLKEVDFFISLTLKMIQTSLPTCQPLNSRQSSEMVCGKLRLWKKLCQPD